MTGSSAALKRAKRILKSVGTRTAATHAKTTGKVYELICLADVVAELKAYGFSVAFSAGAGKLAFKAAPGPVNFSYPHFDVSHPRSGTLHMWTDIEFLTLSDNRIGVHDLSRYHELDIALIAPVQDGDRPTIRQIILAVECKARSSGFKETAKQVLGVRRELSLLADDQPSALSRVGGPHRMLPADPSSEFRLYHSDGRILQYTDGPQVFGIEVRYVPA